VTECEFCGKTHRSSAALDACKGKAERAAARQAKKDAEVLRRQRNLDKLPVQEFVRRTRAAGGAGGTWERIASALNKDYPERRDGISLLDGKGQARPYDVWEVVYEYTETLGWPVSRAVATEMILEKHMTGMYTTVHPLELPAVRGSLYKVGVISPEQLRLATGEDMRVEDEIDDTDT
jgi:hypothetical protein